jgi:hypothetical protein
MELTLFLGFKDGTIYELPGAYNILIGLKVHK